MAPRTDWNPVLRGEFSQPYWSQLQEFVDAERGRHAVYPPADEVFAAILRKLENIPLPCLADIEQQDVMRFGERKQEIASISPLPPEMVPSRAAAGTAVAKAS